MIDSHCHLEQKNYDKDRDEFIESLKKELKAVVTCCARPKDFEITMKMIENHKNFVFGVFGVHPEYIKDIPEEEIQEYLELLRQNKDKIVGIGETGLDFWYIKEESWKEKQKELFLRLIEFSKELGKPLVIHAREAFEETIDILEQQDCENVLMHMFGAKQLVPRIIENGWYVSIGPVIKKSKNHKKIAKNMPLDKILLETDSPWFGDNQRGTPLNIKLVAEKIAEVKKIDFNQIWKKCGENSIKFFKLSL